MKRRLSSRLLSFNAAESQWGQDLKSRAWRRRRAAGCPDPSRFDWPQRTRRRSGGEGAGVKALNNEDDYVSRVLRSAPEFMSYLRSAHFLPCSLH